MKIIKNQIIAKEGVLTYGDRRYLKRWSDLEKLIGNELPIPDEHPLGNKMRPDIRSFGKAKFKKCPLGANLLCADLYLDDDAPDKLGYSIGFPFKEINEPGTFHAEHFDAIQVISDVDHLALTNFPRDPNAINTDFVEMHYFPEPLQEITAVMGDAVKNVNLSGIAIDSYKFVPNAVSAFDSLKECDHTMGELEDIKKQLEEFKKFKEGYDSVNSQLQNTAAELKAYKEKEIAAEKAKIQNAIDSLKSEWEFTDKELEGKDSKEILGAKWALDLVKSAIPKSNAEATLIPSKNAGDSIPKLSALKYKNGQLTYE